MKTKYVWLLILQLIAGLPLASEAQVLKNLLNNMKNNGTKPGTQPANNAISPADSAAAIKSFMSGTGGSGWLYQYKVTYNISVKNKNTVSTDTTSSYLTDSHNARTDIGMMGSRMSVLGHAGMPRYSVTLFPDSKTYKFNVIDTALVNSSMGATYQVTKVGNETIQGYNCIHAKMITITAGKQELTMEIWTCKDVPGYALMKRLTTVQNVTPPMWKALEQAGCDGMFVKMTMQGPSYAMDMVLIKANQQTFPDAMFRIPADYTQQTKINPYAH
jgi:hypothetical protein